jgi:hypothetical protein
MAFKFKFTGRPQQAWAAVLNTGAQAGSESGGLPVAAASERQVSSVLTGSGPDKKGQPQCHRAAALASVTVDWCC